jgi:hypothetical protein
MKTELFVNTVRAMLDEALDTHHGIFLDKGTSLFETLDALTAAQASRSTGRCATVAAHVAHVTFYFEVLERYMATGAVERTDWRAIWNTVGSVTPGEWDQLKRQLRDTSQRIRSMVRDRSSWEDEAGVGGALALVAHTAYHLGAIRQAVCANK